MNWDLVDHAKRLMTNFGAAWVMWLLLALSVVSVAIMLERGWFYYSLRDDLAALARSLGDYLRRGEVAEARRLLENSPSAEAAVVVAGLVESERGAQAAEEAMAGAAALQRMKLEKRLVYLGTLGNNAPFVGLLGTVIGIVQAFDELGKAAKMQTAQTASTIAPQTVMTSIAEALVATAIGLLVAIPAVAAYNAFQRLTKSTLANTEVLSRILLAHLKAVTVPEQAG
ncbi:MAG TPA: MotA/TolQ/ExbB proton channel family protein [Polyangiaceae bacterium]|jgi:biopolymer transport protein ExbB|nr:MotA/TolQ/ExbB proton channel family protein [Polyangiaceae bacterium]